MAPDLLPSIRSLLARGPLSAREIADHLEISQPTVSRLLRALGREIIRFGPYRSIHYALRRTMVAEGDIPIYRVTGDGRIEKLGDLTPVVPQGYAMTDADGSAYGCEGFPWWLYDMWPQGFLGRAFVAGLAAPLGLPERLGDWREEHVLRALLSPHGSDAVGNLLLGERSRQHFIDRADPAAIPADQRPARYAELSRRALTDEVPASSAGGAQPKFAAYAETAGGPRHVLVKFTLPGDNDTLGRWRDLLLAEHHALTLLRENGLPAAATQLVDHDAQRFLEVERFDRIGTRGRRGLISLTALDAEFCGLGRGIWPAMSERLAGDGHITAAAHRFAGRLHAFGALIGNTDMHPGNLSFVTDSGRPYETAPAYDMLPMAFAPRASGELPETLAPPSIDARVPNEVWREAAGLARQYLERLRAEAGFSEGFEPCLRALTAHLDEGMARIGRLG